MKGKFIPIVFSVRQTAIRAASFFHINTTFGPILAEYRTHSETKVASQTASGYGWQYEFLIQPEDVPAGLDICNFDARIINPAEPLTPFVSPYFAAGITTALTGAGARLNPYKVEIAVSPHQENLIEIREDGIAYIPETIDDSNPALVPSGGANGQTLIKVGTEDFETRWGNFPSQLSATEIVSKLDGQLNGTGWRTVQQDEVYLHPPVIRSETELLATTSDVLVPGSTITYQPKFENSIIDYQFRLNMQHHNANPWITFRYYVDGNDLDEFENVVRDTYAGRYEDLRFLYENSSTDPIEFSATFRAAGTNNRCSVHTDDRASFIRIIEYKLPDAS